MFGEGSPSGTQPCYSEQGHMDSGISLLVAMVTDAVTENEGNRKARLKEYLECGETAAGLTSEEYHEILLLLGKFHDMFILREGEQTWSRCLLI